MAIYNTEILLQKSSQELIAILNTMKPPRLSPPGANKQVLIDMVLGAQSAEIQKAAEAATIPEKSVGQAPALKKTGKQYRVTIMDVENGDHSAAVLGHNGVLCQIERGKEIILDEIWVEKLRHATVTTQVSEQRPDGTRYNRPITYQRYPFSAVPI